LSDAFANPCAERTSTIELAGCEARLLVISGDDLLALHGIARRRLRFKVASLPPHCYAGGGFAVPLRRFAVLFDRYGGFATKVKQACLWLCSFVMSRLPYKPVKSARKVSWYVSP
jgi:hypothetical protein